MSAVGAWREAEGRHGKASWTAEGGGGLAPRLGRKVWSTVGALLSSTWPRARFCAGPRADACLIAPRAHYKRLITALSERASPFHLCANGRGEDIRCSGLAEMRRVNAGPQPQQSSFQKARAWRPRPHPLGTAPSAHPLTPRAANPGR